MEHFPPYAREMRYVGQMKLDTMPSRSFCLVDTV